MGTAPHESERRVSSHSGQGKYSYKFNRERYTDGPGGHLREQLRAEKNTPDRPVGHSERAESTVCIQKGAYERTGSGPSCVPPSPQPSSPGQRLCREGIKFLPRIF